MTTLDYFAGQATKQRVTVFYTGADGELHQQSARLVMIDETGVLTKKGGDYTFFPASRVVKIERRESE